MTTAAPALAPRRHALARSIQFIAIAVALFWSLAPVYWMLVTSFKTELEATQPRSNADASASDLDNYTGLAGTSLPFFAFFLNTVISCVATAVIALAVRHARGLCTVARALPAARAGQATAS